MSKKLDGKIAVVTAAGQGIGRASALAFAEAGATVWATDINEGALASLDGIANIRTARLDVLDAVRSPASSVGLVASMCCSIVPVSCTAERYWNWPTRIWISPSTSTSAP